MCVWNFQHGKFQKNAAFIIKTLKNFRGEFFFNFLHNFLSGLTLSNLCDLYWFSPFLLFWYFFHYVWSWLLFLLRLIRAESYDKNKIQEFFKPQEYFYSTIKFNSFCFSLKFLWIDELSCWYWFSLFWRIIEMIFLLNMLEGLSEWCEKRKIIIF